MLFITTLNLICDFLNTNIEELPFHLHTSCFDFPFCFYFDETDSDLIVFVTQDDGAEKLTVVSKKEIVSWDICYKDDIEKLFGDDSKDSNIISLYE